MADETDIQAAVPSLPRGRQAGRFSLALHTVNALTALAVLKMEGPVYADYLIAGWFVVSALSALASRHVLRSRSMRLVFLAVALFYLGSAVSVAWLTWTTPPEHTHDEEDTMAREPLKARGLLINT